MKLLYEFGVIMAVTFLGEICHAVLPFPIPASIYGLLLMLFAALYFYRDSLHEIFEGVKALSAKTLCVTFLFSFV